MGEPSAAISPDSATFGGASPDLTSPGLTSPDITVDTVAVTLVVHACPPAQVREVLAAVNGYRLSAGRGVAQGCVTLGVGYRHPALPRGTVDAVARRLTAGAGAACWTVAETSAGPQPGTVLRWVPGLGLWRGRHGVTEDGAPLVSVDQVRAAAGRAALHELLGAPWQDVIAGLPRGVVVAPQTYTGAWRSDTGTFTVAGWPSTGVPATTRRPAHAALAGFGWLPVSTWWAHPGGYGIEVCRIAEVCHQPYPVCERCGDPVVSAHDAPLADVVVRCRCNAYDGFDPAPDAAAGTAATPVSLLPLQPRSAPGCDCWPLPGVTAPVNGPTGVQTCPLCAGDRSDLDAAQQLADAVGGVVRFFVHDPVDQFAYDMEPAAGDDAEDYDSWLARQQVGTYGGPGDDRDIAGRTDPWVEVAGVPVAWRCDGDTPATRAAQIAAAMGGWFDQVLLGDGLHGPFAAYFGVGRDPVRAAATVANHPRGESVEFRVTVPAAAAVALGAALRRLREAFPPHPPALSTAAAPTGPRDGGAPSATAAVADVVGLADVDEVW